MDDFTQIENEAQLVAAWDQVTAALSAAQDAYALDPSAENKVALTQAQVDVNSIRSFWRAVGEGAGTRRFIKVEEG